MKLLQGRSQDRNQRILDVALQVFSERGYSEARVDEIAELSRTSKGGVYFHFPSKQAIFVALLDRTRRRLLARIEEAMALHEDPIARADAALVAVLRTFASHRSLARLFLVEAASGGPEFHSRIVSMQEEFIAEVKRQLDEAVELGAIAPIDTDIGSRAWFGALNQVITSWLHNRQPARLEDAYAGLRPFLLRSIGLADPGAGVAIRPTPPALPFDPAGLEALLRPLLERGRTEAARRGAAVLVSATVRVRRIDPATLFAAAPPAARTFWEASGGALTLVGAGSAADLRGTGEDRCGSVAAGWSELLADAVIAPDDSCPVDAPLALGGFAFAPDGAAEGPWQGYGTALLRVPAYLLVAGADACWLSVTTLMGANDDHAARAAELAAGLDALVRGAMAQDADDDDAAAVLEGEDPAHDRSHWLEAVSAVVEDIRADAAEKVVLARAVSSQASRPQGVTAALRRLRERYGDSTTVFAIGQGDATFMGATPERLVKVEGRLVETASVAGTVARGASAAEDAALGRSLLSDEKEQHEHAVVVRALRESLSPLCADLDVPKAPVLLRNPAVQHLYTPLRGRLRQDCGVLDLVARLHPTPAVGGMPRAAALERIGRYERFDRGWYAGPVGWVDREGGGQFVVAIRSALVTGLEARLYAGCGIVADSQPEREYEESELKLRPMRWALTGQ